MKQYTKGSLLSLLDALELRYRLATDRKRQRAIARAFQRVERRLAKLSEEVAP